MLILGPLPQNGDWRTWLAMVYVCTDCPLSVGPTGPLTPKLLHSGMGYSTENIDQAKVFDVVNLVSNLTRTIFKINPRRNFLALPLSSPQIPIPNLENVWGIFVKGLLSSFF